MSTATTPRTTRGPHERKPAPRLHGLLAEFETPAAIMQAATEVNKAGYRWWDCHVPFPVHGLDRAMGVRPTILPWLVFFGGATGTAVGFILQWYTNTADFGIWAGVWVHGYPFLISGKPTNAMSVPSFIPVMFELTILLAALTAVFGMLVLNGLPRHYHAAFKSDRFMRATDDRFFIIIEARDPKFSRSRTEQLLQSLNPTAIEALEE